MALVIFLAASSSHLQSSFLLLLLPIANASWVFVLLGATIFSEDAFSTLVSSLFAMALTWAKLIRGFLFPPSPFSFLLAFCSSGKLSRGVACFFSPAVFISEILAAAGTAATGEAALEGSSHTAVPAVFIESFNVFWAFIPLFTCSL